jgi:hypothetical protein
VPITMFLAGPVFDPETIEVMSIAFERMCRELKLVDRKDPVTEIVAKTIIALTESGERDPEVLFQQALIKFRGSSASAHS